MTREIFAVLFVGLIFFSAVACLFSFMEDLAEYLDIKEIKRWRSLK